MNNPHISHSYDEVPYPSLSYTQSHPDRLATIAILLGLKPPPVSECRILEIGCASGGNLIPIAYNWPDSKFTGIDSSAHQIREGQQTIAALGLKNITLHQTDIMDIEAGFGQFDYIIAHGIYSWVAAPVRDKLLQICQQNLSPDGVAYISYNTYPGWHMVGLMREMMLYHTRHIQEPEKRVSEARALLDFLAEATSQKTLYGAMINLYREFLQGELKEDAFLLHDELEEVNEPVYFHQFIQQAEEHGLQYLAEAQFSKVFPNEFSPQVTETLGQMAHSLTDVEQYLDFLRNNTFRQTLLCHQDISIRRDLNPEAVTGFYTASKARAVSDEPNIDTVSVEQFRSPNGAVLSTDHPVSKAALVHLNQIWPQAISFEGLLDAAQAHIYGPGLADLDSTIGATDAEVLRANLLRAYSYSDQLMEFHSQPLPPFTRQVSDRPAATPVSRLQAQTGNVVTNQRHERVRLSEFDRFLLQHLDGAYNQAALVDAFLAGPVAEGKLVRRKNEQPVTGSEQERTILTEEIAHHLRWLAEVALLVG